MAKLPSLLSCVFTTISISTPSPQLWARNGHKVSDTCSDFICRRIDGKMTGIKNMNFSVRHVLAITLRFAEIKRQIVLTPDNQQARLHLAHPCLPLRVGIDVRAVVVEE